MYGCRQNIFNKFDIKFLKRRNQCFSFSIFSMKNKIRRRLYTEINLVKKHFDVNAVMDAVLCVIQYYFNKNSKAFEIDIVIK